MRQLVGLLIAAVVAVLLWNVLGPGPQPDPIPEGGFVSSEQCMDCHPKVYEEWSESQHSQSWINPEVNALSNHFANTDCIDCHAPQDLFATGIGKRALPRADRRAAGVDCLSCHRVPEDQGGGMAGSIDNPNVACRPTIRRELTRVEYCGSCHNQHGTVDQWSQSKFAIKGPGYKDCRDCHMPMRTGPGESGRSHLFHGGHNMDMVRSAVALRAMRDAANPARIAIEVENHGAGHAYPTDERSRASDVFWRPTPDNLDAVGGWRHLYRIRDPYRSEVDLPRTLIDAGETLELSLENEASGGPIQVALFYKLTPYYRDGETGLARPLEEVDDPETDASLVWRVEVDAQ